MNNLIVSTGSNIGERYLFLKEAKSLLAENFSLIEESQIYESSAVDYLNQPDFLNQVLHFQTSEENPLEVLKVTMKVEKELGRKRDIDKGPRTLDIDLLFWNLEELNLPDLQIPHPRQFQRSFIIKPLLELSYSSQLIKKFDFPQEFDNTCWVFSETKT